MKSAIEEARISLVNGGFPIGSILVLDNKIIGRGQGKSPPSVILHAEMDALENAGQLSPEDYGRSIMYTTLSPCQMCAGAIVYYGIKIVVMAENETFLGAEDFLQSHGVTLINLDLQDSKDLLQQNLDRLG